MQFGSHAEREKPTIDNHVITCPKGAWSPLQKVICGDKGTKNSDKGEEGMQRPLSIPVYYGTR